MFNDKLMVTHPIHFVLAENVVYREEKSSAYHEIILLLYLNHDKADDLDEKARKEEDGNQFLDQYVSSCEAKVMPLVADEDGCIYLEERW